MKFSKYVAHTRCCRATVDFLDFSQKSCAMSDAPLTDKDEKLKDLLCC